MRAAKGVLIVAATLLPLAASSAPKMELVFTAPEGCPPRAEIEAEIAARLANSKSDGVRATIRIEATPTGFRTTV
ncbi:MAG: hypothetical protein ACXWUG_13365, partial [Polyangiales bacterium]